MLGLKGFKNYVWNYGNASSFSFQIEAFSIENFALYLRILTLDSCKQQ